MHPNLQEIKKLRQQAELTQQELAKRANVSQSLIAKIEAGTIDPTYTKALHIIETLHNIHKKKEKQAEDFMNNQVISVRPQEALRKVILKMKRYGISQLPVIDNQTCLGMIAETDILEAFTKDLPDPLVQDIMEDAPPVIPHTTRKKAIVELLSLYPMVLVTKKGKLSGIITKADLISKLY